MGRNYKLSTAQREKVRELLRAGVPVKDLARRFDVHPATIRDVVKPRYVKKGYNYAAASKHKMVLSRAPNGQWLPKE